MLDQLWCFMQQFLVVGAGLPPGVGSCEGVGICDFVLLQSSFFLLLSTLLETNVDERDPSGEHAIDEGNDFSCIALVFVPTPFGRPLCFALSAKARFIFSLLTRICRISKANCDCRECPIIYLSCLSMCWMRQFSSLDFPYRFI